LWGSPAGWLDKERRRATAARNSPIQTVNRRQRLLAELTPGQAKRDITVLQAKGILASVRPRDLAGKTRRRLAVEQLTELVAVEKKIKTLTKELKAMVQARGSTLMDLPGVGPVVAARILADVGDVARFADRNRFASWTAQVPACRGPGCWLTPGLRQGRTCHPTAVVFAYADGSR
jgi:transposase